MILLLCDDCADARFTVEIVFKVVTAKFDQPALVLFQVRITFQTLGSSVC